jgi:predicted RNA-binding Zn ribbon-like protein
MNTVWADREGLHDGLRDAARLAAWLQGVAARLPPGLALQGARPSRELVAQFRELRDALRGLAAAVTGDGRPRAAGGPAAPGLAAAVKAVNTACARTPLWPHLTWPGPGAGAPARTLRSAGTAPAAALSWIAGEAVLLFTGPGAQQLRACPGPGCVLYFVRAHPRREWCSAVCGNRARVARHYQRHRPAAARRRPDTPGSRASAETEATP